MNTSVKTTDTDRLRAFQIQTAAARQAAGFKPKVNKHQVKSTSAAQLYSYDEFRICDIDLLSPERVAFWRQLDARQECWSQAVDAFESYRATNTLDYLKACQAQAAATGSERHLDKVEAQLGDGKMTEGPFPMRKWFWTFVGYKLRGIIPRDLVFLVSTHAQAGIEADAAYTKQRALESAAA